MIFASSIVVKTKYSILLMLLSISMREIKFRYRGSCSSILITPEYNAFYFVIFNVFGKNSINKKIPIKKLNIKDH